MKTGKYRPGVIAIALMALAMLSGCDLFTGPTGATGPEGPSVYLKTASGERIYSGGVIDLGVVKVMNGVPNTVNLKIVNESKKSLSISTGMDAETELQKYVYTASYYFLDSSGAYVKNPTSSYHQITEDDGSLTGAIAASSSSGEFTISLPAVSGTDCMPHKKFRIDMLDQDGNSIQFYFLAYGIMYYS
jgi:hypothetical protein